MHSQRCFCAPKKRLGNTRTEKRLSCASRKNLFSNHEEISEGPLNTVSRHSLNTVLTLSCMRERDTRTDRQTDRSLETSDRAGRFSLSFCIIKMRARVNNRSRRKHINGRERFHLPFEKRYKKISPPNVRRVKAPRKEKIFLERNHGCRRPTERAVEPKRRTK